METSIKVYVSRKFNCAIDELFQWMVEPSLISKWFGPKHFSVGNIEANLRVGGAYRIELVKSNGEGFTIEGKYIEIEAPNKLVFSFKYHGHHNPPPESIVKITLEQIDLNISKLSLVQQFEIAPLDMEGRTKAWEAMFAKLSEKTKIGH